MKNTLLTVSERAYVERARDQTRDKESYRKLSVLVMLDEGHSQLAAATALGISEGTVYNCKVKYDGDGLETYLDLHYVPYCDRLSDEQLAELETEVDNGLYSTAAQVRDKLRFTSGTLLAQTGDTLLVITDKQRELHPNALKPLCGDYKKMLFVKKISVLLFLLGLYTNCIIYAQKTTNIAEKFENGLSTDIQIKDSTVNHFNIYDRMKFRKVPAVSVAVIKNGTIVLFKNYGYADISKGIKTDSTTLFHFASISKTINALCIMKLAEEGKLSLTSDFRAYIKDGSFKETKYSKGQKITIANLLSHTAGINRDDGPSGDYTHNKPLPTITQIIKGEKPALGNGAYSIRKPNETYEYSNQAIAITQKILADNFDEDYNRLLTNMILNPLKMSRSTFALKLDSAQEKQLAHGYVYDYQTVPSWVFPCQAEGGLVSTTEDIAKMVIAIQNAYNEIDTTFLKKSSIQTMFTPQLGTNTYNGNLNLPYKNGLGVMLFEKGGRQYFTHTGSIDGYTAVYIGSFDGIDGAVIVVNTSYAGIFTEILNSIATTFEWENYIDYKYQVAIKPQHGDAFTGTYKIKMPKSTFTYTITQKNDKFYILNSNNGTEERLYFSSDTSAFVLSKGYTIEFIPKHEKIVIKNNGEFSGEAVKQLN